MTPATLSPAAKAAVEPNKPAGEGSAPTPPLLLIYDGEALVPRYPAIADKHLVIGQVYRMVEQEDRSSASHRHYFAVINEAHRNLPEDLAERFPTPEALRKYALIRAGYRDERSIVCTSRAEALRLAGFIRPMDAYAIVTVQEAVVRVYTAQSQSLKAMGKKDFGESKTAVMDALAALIGVDPATLQANAGAAA
jgi:hypothetical protein